MASGVVASLAGIMDNDANAVAACSAAPGYMHGVATRGRHRTSDHEDARAVCGDDEVNSAQRDSGTHGLRIFYRETLAQGD